MRKLLTDIRKEQKAKNVNFSAFLKLYNEKVLINEEKVDIRSYGSIRIVLEDENKNAYWDDISITSSKMDGLEQEIDSCVSSNLKVIERRKNKYSPLELTSSDVVFSPKATGYLIHEIIGHTLEGDLYSYYKDKYTDLKISKKLTVCDSVQDADFAASINKYDDLGIEVKPLVLVKNQKICNIMTTDRESSFDNKLYGFARRENYRKEVMSRMRCTYILPNENLNQENIMSKYNDAILMDKAYLGGVDVSTGNYFVEGTGFVLRNGEKQNVISNLRISGNIMKNLFLFEYIGNDFWLSGSYCMKLGHYLKVGCGGPAVSLNGLSVEGNVYESK